MQPPVRDVGVARERIVELLEYQLEAGRLRASLPVYKRRLQFALDGLDKMFERCPRVYVSLSFGKQSLVIAHMVFSIRPNTPMFFLASSESWEMHNFADVITEFLSQTPVNLTIVQTNRLGADLSGPIIDLATRCPGVLWRFTGWDRPGDSWETSRQAGKHDLQNMTQRDAWDGWIWGLAKEESRARRLTLSRKWDGQPHPSIFRYSDGKFRCCPLANWEVMDLAAYIAMHNLPLLSEYHRHGLEARTTARMTGRAAAFGGATSLRQRDALGFNDLARMFPELREYT